MILQIGPVSALVEFLDVKERMILNLLCRRFYRVVMPGISGSFLIYVSREFSDWLEWGKIAAGYVIKVQRGLNIKIGSNEGKYYGEWQVNGNETTVWGRAALKCKDKWILGYTENREW